MKDDDSDWIQTFNGHKVWPLKPHHPGNTFDIEDVAHALAMKTRFGGHLQWFYSVAEHCVLGSRLVPQEWALAFLMHDAAEAYLADVPSPVKTDEFRAIENALLTAILNSLGISGQPLDVMKSMDVKMLVREASNGFKGGQHPDWRMTPAKGFPAAEVNLKFWDWERAEIEFLERYRELTVNIARKAG